MNNSQVAHVWAQQQKAKGKNGNGSLSFEGVSIRSYSTEVARFIDGRVVYTAHKYSTTTSQHLSDIRSAIRHLPNYSTSLKMRDIPLTWELTAPIIFNDMLEGIAESIDNLKRSRVRISYSITRIIEKAGEAQRFLQTLESPFIASTALSGKGITLTQLGLLTDIGISTSEVLKNEFGIDTALKLQKERLQEEKDLEKFKARQEAQEAHRAAMLLDEETAYNRWMSDPSFNRTFHNLPIALRINQDTLETSRGAQVPLSHAILIYQDICDGLNVKGKSVGHFTVTDIRDNHLIVGCHTIPLVEVQRIAKVLGIPDRKAVIDEHLSGVYEQ